MHPKLFVNKLGKSVKLDATPCAAEQHASVGN
jgi:hypothetical protein